MSKEEKTSANCNNFFVKKEYSSILEIITPRILKFKIKTGWHLK